MVESTLGLKPKHPVSVLAWQVLPTFEQLIYYL